jgi:hypothetical protein
VTDIKGCHEFIAGTTQSGKTEVAKKRAERFKGGVLFFNPQRVPMPRDFILINKFNDVKAIASLLDQGYKFNYLLDHRDTVAKKELDYITDYIFSNRVKSDCEMPIKIVVDEAHVFLKNNQQSPVLNLATRGLRYKIYLCSITQRPALTNNTLFTQSELKIYGHIEEEDVKYFTGQGIPMQQVQDEIKKAGKYHFINKHVECNNGFKDGYSKPFKENI